MESQARGGPERGETLRPSEAERPRAGSGGPGWEKLDAVIKEIDQVLERNAAVLKQVLERQATDEGGR
jgi:hypothetical protein